MVQHLKHYRTRFEEKYYVMLKDGRMSAGEIADHFDMTNATVSYHLSVLKKADLVWETKEKNYIYL